MADKTPSLNKHEPRGEDFHPETPPRERYPLIALPKRHRRWRPEISRGAAERLDWARRLAVALLWAIVLFLAGGAALRVFFHDRWIPLVWWNSFTLYVYLPVYFCLAAALALGRWRLAGLAALVAACHVAWIAPDFLPRGLLGDSRGEQPVGTLRLYYQNLNIHTDDFSRRIEAVLEAQPDVIGLVEFNRPWEAAVRESPIFTQYPHHTLRANPLRSQQLALFSKVPLEDVEHRFILGRRLAVAATVRVNGSPLRVFCIHAPRPLQEQVEQYRRYWEDVIAWISETALPRVVVGDFNATQHAACYQRLCSYAALHSAHRDAGRGYAVTWPNGRTRLPPIRIDHVLLSPKLACPQIREGGGGSSDHKPLICDLELVTTAEEPEDEEGAGP